MEALRKYAVVVPAVLVAVLATVLVSTTSAYAHHILGIPHYAYEKDYPQTPVLTYRVDAGAYEIKMTGYPGTPMPGEQCSMHVYISRLDGGELYDGPVTMTVWRDRFFGDDPVIYGPITTRLDERLYKFYPRFGEASDYLVRIHFEADGAPWDISLPVVVGEPGSPALVLGGAGAGLLVFLIVIRALRIKAARRRAGVDARGRPLAASGRGRRAAADCRQAAQHDGVPPSRCDGPTLEAQTPEHARLEGRGIG